MSTLTDDGLLMTGDVARLMGCSNQRVQQLADAGRLPATRTIRGLRLFFRDDVLAFLKARDAAGPRKPFQRRASR